MRRDAGHEQSGNGKTAKIFSIYNFGRGSSICTTTEEKQGQDADGQTDRLPDCGSRTIRPLDDKDETTRHEDAGTG